MQEAGPLAFPTGAGQAGRVTAPTRATAGLSFTPFLCFRQHGHMGQTQLKGLPCLQPGHPPCRKDWEGGSIQDITVIKKEAGRSSPAASGPSAGPGHLGLLHSLCSSPLSALARPHVLVLSSQQRDALGTLVLSLPQALG